MNIPSFFSHPRISEVLLNLFCIIVGITIAYRYFSPAIALENQIKDLHEIRNQIEVNNETCRQAVESNKTLKEQADAKIVELTNKIANPPSKEVSLSESGEEIPASLPQNGK